MNVVIIGAGNVATVFGRLIKKAHHQILQVVSKNISHAHTLAKELECSFANNREQLNREADIYLFAIGDAALNEMNQSYFVGDKLVLHTAGSVSMEILKLVSVNYGVMYPLQSLRKENMDVPADIPLLIDGSSAGVISEIEKFALTLTSTVAKANDEQRLKLHVAAVVVNNFTNHLYALAVDYCAREDLDFKMLQPLIEETATRLRHHHPDEMQTGPASRKDRATIKQHLDILAQYPELKKVYNCITESIMDPRFAKGELKE